MLRSFAMSAWIGLALTTAINAQSSEREQELLARIAQLEQRLAALEQRFEKTPTAPATAAADAAAPQPSATATAQPAAAPQAGPLGLTLAGTVDGYYEYNFNRPVS